MKSIKPGRGPSLLSGIMGIFVAIFGVIWTVFALSMGAGWLFAGFGIVFICAAVAITVFNLKNATQQNRYSSFDITSGNEEPDPLNERFGSKRDDNGENGNSENSSESSRGNTRYCPWCGAKQDAAFRYCESCGNELPGKHQ